MYLYDVYSGSSQRRERRTGQKMMMRRNQGRGWWALERSFSGTTSSGQLHRGGEQEAITVHNVVGEDLLCCCALSRSLLCNLVRVKLGCYELEGKNSLSLEDYLKAFMETEVKPLWPKGWMQARCVSLYTNCPQHCACVFSNYNES